MAATRSRSGDGDGISAAARRSRSDRRRGARRSRSRARRFPERSRGSGRWRRPSPTPHAGSAECRRARRCLRQLRATELGAAGWDDLLDEARTRHRRFAGGELRISPTPAMTLIDVDGFCAPDELAVPGAGRAARGDPPARHRRLDRHRPADRRRQGGAAGGRRGDRRVLPQPFERTAVNGFGFVQIVRPAPPRVAGRAGAGPRGVRGPGAAARARRSSRRARTARRPSRGGRRARRRAGLARRAGAPGRRRGQLAGRPDAPHVRRLCRTSLKPSAARCAASRQAPSTRRSAAAAARTATC